MSKKEEKGETIMLDARISAVLDIKAFRALLDNGHELTVYRRAVGEHRAIVRVGDRVRVRISPYDFSVGEIVEQETEVS
jgi:translation initiation factor IF-1